MIAAIATLPAFSAQGSGTVAPRPIEVEVERGTIPCAPSKRFEAGFRSVMRQRHLIVMDATHATRVMPNAFCLAGEQPSVKALHVRVRIFSDQGMFIDYCGPAPGAVQSQSHWLVHVAVPFRVIRGAPVARQRTSFWARSDRENYCESMGRVVALCVLEKLCRESGKLRPTESVDLGLDVARDMKYSEARDDWWALARDNIATAFPMLVAWGMLLMIAFALVRLAQGIRQRGRRREELRSAGSR